MSDCLPVSYGLQLLISYLPRLGRRQGGRGGPPFSQVTPKLLYRVVEVTWEHLGKGSKTVVLLGKTFPKSKRRSTVVTWENRADFPSEYDATTGYLGKSARFPKCRGYGMTGFCTLYSRKPRFHLGKGYTSPRSPSGYYYSTH